MPKSSESHPALGPCAETDTTTHAWYLAYSKPRQEHIAEQQLLQQGYITYLPQCPLRQKSSRIRSSGTSSELESMFPRYVFVRPGRPSQSLAPVRSTRGITTLVSFGHGPVEVPPEVIEQVREAERLARLQKPWDIEPVPVGSFVRLADERLRALEGLVTAVAGDRVTILLNILGREKSLTVGHNQVELC